MNIERDKYLTEAMGGFWHYSVMTGFGNECSCGKWWSECVNKHPNFSTWEGFGKLWEWAKEQKWWNEMLFNVGCLAISGTKMHSIIRLIEPDIFANAVYKYLKEKDK